MEGVRLGWGCFVVAFVNYGQSLRSWECSVFHDWPSRNSVWDVPHLDGSESGAAISLILENVSNSEAAEALAFLKTPNEQGLRTYAVLDPTLREAVTGIFDLDTIDVDAQSLFDGRAAEQNEEVAPYLVDVTVRSADQVSLFNRRFLREHWGRSTGILVRSRGTFD